MRKRVICILLLLILIGLILFGAVSLHERTYWTELSVAEARHFPIESACWLQ